MGCLEKKSVIHQIDQTFFTDKENEKIPVKGEIDINEIPNDQFLCPKCKRVPEILNIDFDEGYIYFKCKTDGIIPKSISDYYKAIKNSPFNYFQTECQNCKNKQGNQDNMFIYCYECQKDLCTNCNNAHDKFGHHTIEVNHKNHVCLKHYDEEVSFFCEDCEEHICKEELKTKHKDHKIFDLNDLYDQAIKYKAKILKKNQTLCDILRLIQITINTFENFPNNYYHLMSVINIGKSMGEKKKGQKEAKQSLRENYNIDLNGYENKINLWNRNLKDEGFKLISKIKFKKLKSIDLSDNNIKNIEYLYRMNLPFLEYLDLSNNQIENIMPIAELNCPELKEICLQNNEIKDISPFLNSNFPKLERLRIDSNMIDQSSESFKNMRDIYKNILYYTTKTVESFNKEYKSRISENIEEEKIIDLSDISTSYGKNGDKMLEDLYLIIPKNNKIHILVLNNNGITNTSLLTRIPLPHLNELNLAVNNITNLKFLNEMKLKKLDYLYLDNNKINDLLPLSNFIDSLNNNDNENIKKIISLKDNNFIEIIGKKNEIKLDEENKKIIQFLIDKKINLDISVDCVNE